MATTVTKDVKESGNEMLLFPDEAVFFPHCIYFPKAAYLAELQSAVQPENPVLVTVET